MGAEGGDEGALQPAAEGAAAEGEGAAAEGAAAEGEGVAAEGEGAAAEGDAVEEEGVVAEGEGAAAEGVAAEGEGATAEGAAAGGEGAAAEGEGAAAGHPCASSAAVHPCASSAAGGTAALGAGTGSSSAWSEGMDPNSSFCLIISLLGNPKFARKEIRSFCFDKIIDSDLTNYNDLVASIVDQYPPRYLEVAHLQYYDEVLNTFPEIKSDQELMTMFEKHSETRSVQMFIQYCDPSVPYQPISEYYTDMHIEPNNKASQDEDSYLRNPIPENEHVGIDEENMYSEKEPIPLVVVPFSDKEKNKHYFREDGSVDGSVDEREDESEDEAEVEEDEEVHEPNHAQTVEYDREDPPMTVGSTYPNMYEFKLAIRQYAIKRDFELNTEKSAPHRFTAHCKRKDEDDCPWRIHASTKDDLCTVVVKTNPFDHDCSSDKKKKKGQHMCPICKDYGHHWHNCKKGNPADIAAMMAVREPPKRKKKTTKTTESSIVPCDDGAPTRMCFPPSLSLETTTKKKGKDAKSSAGASKRKSLEGTSSNKGKKAKCDSGGSKRSRIGSTQLLPLSIESSMPNKQTNIPVKVGGKHKKKELVTKIPMVPFDSPAMGTRSRKINPGSPAMSTRSKRRLSL